MKRTTFQMHCPKCLAPGVGVNRERGWGGRPEEFILHCGTCGLRIYGNKAIEEIHAKQKRVWEKQAPKRVEPPQEKPDPAIRTVLRQDRRIIEHLTQEVQDVVKEVKALKIPPVSTSIKDDKYIRMARLQQLDHLRFQDLLQEFTQIVESPEPLYGGRQTQARNLLGLLREQVRRLVGSARRVQEAFEAIPDTLIPTPTPPSTVKLSEAPVCAREGCSLPSRPNSKYCVDNCRVLVSRQNHRKRKKAPKQPVQTKAPRPRLHKTDVQVVCTWCGAAVWKKTYAIRKSKTGMFFCNHDHHQKWFVANGGPSKIAKIQAQQRREQAATVT